ncbi:MAG: type II secretion system F family protein [Candidatus Portnoybacteria bacterium]|nr:type II secretion system F family protein [Candidatus Portnoybacteria bacterium]
MSSFTYTAISPKGEKSSGTKEAVSVSELAKSLREEGLILTSSQSSQKEKSGLNFKKILDALQFFNRVPLVEKMLFARHLAVMVKAGFSLNKALQVLVMQTKNRHFQKIISSLEQDVRRGTSFGDALAKFPEVFSDLFINMVRVGETAGNLEENLKLLAVQMQKDHDLRSKIKSAMMYPAVIFVAMLGIGISMMIFVVPKLVSVFEELKVDLPPTTRLIIALSQFLTNYWFVAIFILLVLFFLARIALRSKRGKEIFDRAILSSPIFGNISKKINSARMARTLSSLIESGVPIIRALEISSGTLSNNLFRSSLLAASYEVQKGKPLSEILASSKSLYPPLVTQMIQVGEETGTLAEITGRLAEFYEEEVTNITKSLSTIIEPILMVIIGAAVGLFAISMIQPMYSVMNNV